MSDGTSLNAKLAEMMPIEGISEGRPPIRNVTAHSETPLEDGTKYSFVVTPASGDMAGYMEGPDSTLSSEEGAPLSGSAPVVDGVFSVKAFSFNGFEEGEGETLPRGTAVVDIYIGYSGN